MANNAQEEIDFVRNEVKRIKSWIKDSPLELRSELKTCLSTAKRILHGLESGRYKFPKRR